MLLSTLLLVGVCWAGEDKTAVFERYLTAVEQTRQEQIARYQMVITGLQNGSVRPGSGTRGQSLRAARKAISELEDAPLLRPGIISNQKVGVIGQIGHGYEVVQVIGPHEMLFGYEYPRGMAIYKMKNVSTTGLTDNDWLPDSFRQRLWEITGTTTYHTATGTTKTVLVYEPFDYDGLEAYIREKATPDWRTWTDTTGKFTSESLMVKATPLTVTLKRRDGQTTDVPLAKLSDNDRSYVAEMKKWQARLAK